MVQKAQAMITKHLQVAVQNNLGFALALNAVEMCTIPASLFGFELCVAHKSFDKTMDKIQERFARRLLGLSKRCPRVMLLHGLGWPLRQITAARARAYTLLVRAHSGPRYDSARRVAVHAAQVRGSLAHCILPFAVRLGLR